MTLIDYFPRVQRYLFDTDKEILEKFKEEIEELRNFTDIDNLKEELCDIMQLCYTLSYKYVEKFIKYDIDKKSDECIPLDDLISVIETILSFDSFALIDRAKEILKHCYEYFTELKVECRHEMLEKHKEKIERRMREWKKKVRNK